MDWNIHHKSGMIIGNVRADTEKQAAKLAKLAKQMFGPTVYVTKV